MKDQGSLTKKSIKICQEKNKCSDRCTQEQLHFINIRPPPFEFLCTPLNPRKLGTAFTDCLSIFNRQE